jgi:ABC-type protease/lipase transport system fused ATPase/permease subunit
MLVHDGNREFAAMGLLSTANPLIGMLRRPLIHVAVFSFVVNLLLLIPALFIPQVFDRVLASQSHETLVMLLLGAAVALGIMSNRVVYGPPKHSEG